jgi:hypothetical protein
MMLTGIFDFGTSEPLPSGLPSLLVEIYDLQGIFVAEVMDEIPTQSQTPIEYSTSNLASGSYLLKCTLGDNVVSAPFVKE